MLRVIFLLLSLALSACAQRAGVAIDSADPPYTPPANAIVLRVKVRKVEFTDFYPDACPEESECIPFYFWYRYEAQVVDVVAGAWNSDEVRFTHLQHAAYADSVVQDCYVVLVPASDAVRNAVGIPFIADRILSRRFVEDRATIKRIRTRGK